MKETVPQHPPLLVKRDSFHFQDGKSVTEVAAAFAMSRFSFYEAQLVLNRDGLPGLVPKKPGPRGGHKITPEVDAYIEAASSQEPTLDARDLLAKVKECFGVMVHPRTITRAGSHEKKTAMTFHERGSPPHLRCNCDAFE